VIAKKQVVNATGFVRHTGMVQKLPRPDLSTLSEADKDKVDHRVV